MKQEIWGKTLLSTYKCLEKIADAIDRLVLSYGLNSRYSDYDALFEIANKMIELTDRKKLLINLKLVIEEALVKLTVDNSKLLVLKYFDKLKSSEIIELLNLSKRNYFRKMNGAIKSFSNALKNMGYNEIRLMEMLKKEHWIMDIYEMNIVDSERKFIDNYIVNKAFNNYKNLSYCAF